MSRRLHTDDTVSRVVEALRNHLRRHPGALTSGAIVIDPDPLATPWEREHAAQDAAPTRALLFTVTRDGEEFVVAGYAVQVAEVWRPTAPRGGWLHRPRPLVRESRIVRRDVTEITLFPREAEIAVATIERSAPQDPGEGDSCVTGLNDKLVATIRAQLPQGMNVHGPYVLPGSSMRLGYLTVGATLEQTLAAGALRPTDHQPDIGLT